MTVVNHEEPAAFQDAVRYVGMAWMQASRLRLRNLTDEQHRATSKVVTALSHFTLALREEFAQQPQSRAEAADRAQAAHEIVKIAPRWKAENPYDKAVKAIGYAWAGLSDLLSMPNRLTEAQRALAGDVLAAINEFMKVDFRSLTRTPEPEAA